MDGIRSSDGSHVVLNGVIGLTRSKAMTRIEIRLIAKKERVEPVAKFLCGGDCQVGRVIAVRHMNKAKTDVPLRATDDVAESNNSIKENRTWEGGI